MIEKTTESSNDMWKHIDGRGRNTILQKDRYVNLIVKRNIHLTPRQIAAHLETATGTNVSINSISRQLNDRFLCTEICSMHTT